MGQKSLFSRKPAFTPVAYNQEDQPTHLTAPAPEATWQSEGRIPSEPDNWGLFTLSAHETAVSLKGEGGTGSFQV